MDSRADDAEALASVHVQGWREAYGHLLPERFYGPEALRRRRAQWQGMLDREGPAIPHLAVARLVDPGAGERVVGFARSGPSRDDPRVCDEELWSIYVAGSVYGTGIGSALLAAVIGDRAASLRVAEDNPRARAFYAKHGFVPDGVRKVDEGLEDLVEVRLVRSGS